MEIRILELIEGAGKARGLTVVIDVFRAFSVACYVMEKGAVKIIPVAKINTAYRLKRKHPEYILIGERDGRIQPGFDYGNSPAAILDGELRGKTVIQTTSAGTQGIAGAVNAQEIITGSFVNARAVARYIKMRQPEIVSLVAMGTAGISPSVEDLLCAKYIHNVLENETNDYEQMVEKIRNTSGRRFFNPGNKDWSPEKDFHLCLNLNRFNFVLKAEECVDGLMYLKKINV